MSCTSWCYASHGSMEDSADILERTFLLLRYMDVQLSMITRAFDWINLDGWLGCIGADAIMQLLLLGWAGWLLQSLYPSLPLLKHGKDLVIFLFAWSTFCFFWKITWSSPLAWSAYYGKVSQKMDGYNNHSIISHWINALDFIDKNQHFAWRHLPHQWITLLLTTAGPLVPSSVSEAPCVSNH
jgi:hypothetical protein